MAMLPPQYAIQLSLEEWQQLEEVLRAGRTQQRMALRAAAMLLADNGLKNREIADELATSRAWVQKWRKRFARYEMKTRPFDDGVSVHL
jgi:transposase-like protein